MPLNGNSILLLLRARLVRPRVSRRPCKPRAARGLVRAQGRRRKDLKALHRYRPNGERQRPKHVGVESRADAGIHGRKPPIHRHINDLESDPLRPHPVDVCIRGRHRHDITRREAQVLDVHCFGTELLHVVLKSPVALEPHGVGARCVLLMNHTRPGAPRLGESDIGPGDGQR